MKASSPPLDVMLLAPKSNVVDELNVPTTAALPSPSNTATPKALPPPAPVVPAWLAHAAVPSLALRRATNTSVVPTAMRLGAPDPVPNVTVSLKLPVMMTLPSAKAAAAVATALASGGPAPPMLVAHATVWPSDEYFTTNPSSVPRSVSELPPNVVSAVNEPTAMAPPSALKAATPQLCTEPAVPAEVAEKSVPSGLKRARKNPPVLRVVAPA